MKETTLKDVIENSRRNWSEEGIKSQDDPYYQGKFWDHTKKKLVRWHELTKQDTQNEEKDTSINST